MSGVIGAGVSLEGMHFPDFEFTFLISGTVTAADEGKAVTIDTAANNTVKLAGDGDPIFGRLQKYENRVQEGIKVATVATKFIATLPIKSASGVARGDMVQGAGAGEIKPLAAQTDTDGVGTPAIKFATHNSRNWVLELVTRDSVACAVVAFGI